MGILLDGFRKQKRYTTNANGDHQLVSTWTHSDTVIMPDGTPLSEAVLGDGNDAVRQTETVDDNDNYEILLSQTADDTTRTEGARKSSKLKFNPYTSSLTMTTRNGQSTLTPNQLTISGVGGEGSLTRNSLVLSNNGTSTTYSYSDIVTDNHNTWDGTNTSLKAAVTNAKGTVTQTETTTSGNYELLFSGTGDDTTRTEGAKKSTYLKFNPTNKSLNIVNEYNDINYKSATVSPTGINVLSAENGVHNLKYTADDIVFNAPSNPPTWDGTNTSLKAALAAAAGAGGCEAVYLPLADYEELTTAEKEDPTKIYFVINEGTKVSPTLSADDGHTTASSKSGNIATYCAPWFVFDGSDRTDNHPEEYAWMPWGQHNGEWVAYEFDQGKSFSKVHIRAATMKAHTMKYYIEGTNDGSNWTNLILGAEYVEANQPAYTGSNYVWVNTDIILDAAKGSFSHIRFRQDTSIGIPYSSDGIYVANWDIYASAASNKPSIYYKNVLYNPDELPVTTISDAGKVLKVNEDGLWDKGDAPIPDVNAVQVPPVIFDNGSLKKVNEISGFSGLEKVYTTPTKYEALSNDEKNDLSKIYYVSDYEFYSDPDNPVVVRVGANNDIKWFFNGYTFASGARYVVPENLREFQAPLNEQGTRHVRCDSNPYASADATSPISSDYFVGWSNYEQLNQIRYSRITGSVSILNGTVYAVIDPNGGAGQTNPYTDPYDIPGGFTIYYGSKQYTEYEIPTPDINAVQIPPVIFDNGKLMKISDMTGFPELEKVFVTSEEYSQLTTAQKQDLSKIYYVSPYKFYSFEDGKIIIRTNDNETKWYFNGFEVPSDGTYNVPSEMSSYFAANQASNAYSDETSETDLGYIELGLNVGVNVIYFQQGLWGGSWIAAGTPVWGVVSKNGGDNQQNTYSDPYDAETPILIYYGGKQYTEYEPAKPYVELTQSEYDALPSSKESDGIIYFING